MIIKRHIPVDFTFQTSMPLSLSGTETSATVDSQESLFLLQYCSEFNKNVNTVIIEWVFTQIQGNICQ